jgi:hypothetical protein
MRSILLPKPSSLLARTGVLERRVISDGLQIEATVSPDGPILQEFFAGYDAAFVLPNEKEEHEGFAKCLSLNFGDSYLKLSRLYGAFRELVLVARDAGSGSTVGGANCIAFPLHAAGDVLSINLNYIFVAPGQRRRGHFKRLVAAVGALAAEFFEPDVAKLPRLMFIEQNDPVQMSRADYRRDTEHAGIDQMTRIGLWTALGARIVDFPYVQPPLSAGQAPDATLLYAVLGAEGAALDACLLHAHLLRFFAISVLKGDDPSANPVAAAQLAELEARCREGAGIPLLTASRLPSLIEEAPAAGGRTSLRELIRSMA